MHICHRDTEDTEALTEGFLRVLCVSVASYNRQIILLIHL